MHKRSNGYIILRLVFAFYIDYTELACIFRLMNKIYRLPKVLIVVIFLLSAVGLTVLYSASNGNIHPWASKQAAYFLMFFLIAVYIGVIRISTIYNIAYPFYVLGLVLLIAVSFMGHNAMGATRWLDLRFIKIQPSELMKIGVIMALSRYFNDLQSIKNAGAKLLIPVFIAVLPTALIIKQPDLGTGILVVATAANIFVAAGVSAKKIIAAIASVSLMIPIIWQYLHEYQRKRISVFLDPEQDPLGSGYNIIQSKIAIGSGGFVGKGFMMGTQSHLEFLPEHQTDFVFAFFAEEFGFLGVLLLMILFAILITAIFSTTIRCRNIFAKLMCSGVCATLSVHIIVNIGMVSGMLPVVGIPLPFISYGGTNMASVLIGLGLVFNAHVNSGPVSSYIRQFRR